MKKICSALMIFLCLLILANPVLADYRIDFDGYMKIWNDRIELASHHLKEAESAFKDGDELQGCVQQRKAANYGIEATQSLIKAFEISGSTDDMSNIESGLDKWKELRDFC